MGGTIFVLAAKLEYLNSFTLIPVVVLITVKTTQVKGKEVSMNIL